VPGYEAVGYISHAPDSPGRVGQMVFVPGSRGFRDISGLFGGAASRLVVPEARVVPIALQDPVEAVLFALAATAHHAVTVSELPDLIVGHGVLGRLAARIIIALGGRPPIVWETDPARRQAQSYAVIAPDQDGVRNYRSVCDLSGDSEIIDKVLPHCERGAQITLAGFYPERCSFSFPLAFMKEVRLSVAAEWLASDLSAINRLVGSGGLSLAGLITHVFPAAQAPAAYAAAFTNPDCLKTVLCWDNLNG
jgi:3-hydroxyethyl bacteriochlorophyllide a dehydrogenase